MKSRTHRGKVGLFGIGMAGFVNRWCREGPTHHCALGVGRVMPALRNIAALLKLPFVEVK